MILDQIAAKTRERVALEKRQLGPKRIRQMAEQRLREEMARGNKKQTGIQTERGMLPFEAALRRPGLSFICEVKKASPSKGVIAAQFPYLKIAKEYEAAGAAAISCLTEPYYFQGSDLYLEEIAAAVTIPVLRKDFTVDPYMIDQAKVLGASAVLLICALLDDGELVEYQARARELGMSALVEAHDEREVERALRAEAAIIGVNNRDLRTFQVDVDNSVRLRKLVPEEVVFVSESGIRGAADTSRLYQNGTNAVLIGETLMRSANKAEALAELAAGA